MDCKERLQAYFQEHNVSFETATHSEAYTAQEVAAALRVSGHQLAKVVMVWAGDELIMIVVPASGQVDLRRAADVLGVEKVRLAREPEFAGRFEDCRLGAMPPFGNLYDLPVVVDPALAEVDDIVFSAGTYTDSMKIAYGDFERLVQPRVGKLILD
ncbi:MAG: YbaK/EbsC family protein [Chloroflexota bacterium]|nr:YbaK/EbsC family protein [Chloroflexota bacterium]